MSPSELRQRALFVPYEPLPGAHTTPIIAEVTSELIFKDGEIDEEGTFSEKLFGGAGRFSRRRHMGIIELPYPAAHVWFMGAQKSRKMATALMDMPARSLLQLRKFDADALLGDWVASDAWPLRQHPLRPSRAEVPCLGTPVAAAHPPRLHRALAGSRALAPPPSTQTARRGDAELASLARAAMRNGLPTKVRLTGALWRQLLRAAPASEEQARVLAHLLRIVSDLPALAGQIAAQAKALTTGDEDPSDLAERALPAIVDRIVRDLADAGVISDDEDLEALLADLEDDERGLGNPSFIAAARENFEELWEAITVPGLATDLGDLQQIIGQLEKLLENNSISGDDTVRALQIVRAIKLRALAALEVVLQAYAKDDGDDEGHGPARSPKAPPSRFSATHEVQWYDGEMPQAAFHVGDVERLRDRMELVGVELQHPEPKAPPPPPPPPAPSPERWSGGITRPRRRGPGGEAVYHRRGQPADPRYHVPMQECVKLGQGGGSCPIEVGAVLDPLTETPMVVRYAAIRPRPIATPLPLPSTMVDAQLYIGSGCQALQRLSHDMEIRQRYLESSAGVRHFQTLVDEDDAKQRLQDAAEFLFAGAPLRSRRKAAPHGDPMNYCCDLKEITGGMMVKLQLPEYSSLQVMPVMPPDLRGMGEDLGVDRLDEMSMRYRSLLGASRDLKMAIQERSPAYRVRYLAAQLQWRVDETIDKPRAEKSNNVVRKKNDRTPEHGSIAERVKGKQGRMRNSLLGKRVNFSARSVIVVDPTIALNEVGMPYEVARMLFHDFLIAQLKNDLEREELTQLYRERNEGTKSWIRRLTKFFERQPKVDRWATLQKILDGKAILLNRAPTLHRLSIQSFKPKLVDGQALRIHPLVCGPFNADFDGDTMTMHVCLGAEATEEAQNMMPSANLSSPANGDVVIGPTQDMVLGLYYLTVDVSTPQQDHRQFDSVEEVVRAFEQKAIHHHAPITLPRIALVKIAPSVVEADQQLREIAPDGLVNTTVGRILLWSCLFLGKDDVPLPLSDSIIDFLDERLDAAEPVLPVAS